MVPLLYNNILQDGILKLQQSYLLQALLAGTGWA